MANVAFIRNPRPHCGSALTVRQADVRLTAALTMRHWTMPKALEAITRAAEGRHWTYAVTPNAAHFARLQARDPYLAAIYRDADFCFLDSRVIAFAARLIGLKPPPVIVGADLVEQLFSRVITPDSIVCIVGGSPESISRLKSRYRLFHIHHLCPPMGFWRVEAELARVARFVADCRAEYTFLCVGSPQQEILADKIAGIGGATGVGICAGASIDFLIGAQRRAPRLVQRLALEWAWRLIAEPRRLAHRYFVESPRGVVFALRSGSGLR